MFDTLLLLFGRVLSKKELLAWKIFFFFEIAFSSSSPLELFILECFLSSPPIKIDGGFLTFFFSAIVSSSLTNSSNFFKYKFVL